MYGNRWISSSMHISFTRLDLKQETTMGKWMQQISSLGAKKLTSNFPPQPVIVLVNSTYHCLQVDRPLSTCIVKTDMIWLSRKSIVSDETISKNDLPVNSSKEARSDINTIDHILANHGHAVWLPPYVWPKPLEHTWILNKQTHAWKHHSRNALPEITKGYLWLGVSRNKGWLTRTLETCWKYPERIFGKRQGCSICHRQYNYTNESWWQ